MKHNNCIRIAAILALGLLTGWAAPCARAGVLYSQPYDGSNVPFNSQVYTDSFAPYSTKAFDVFVVPTAQVWNITQVTIFGQDQGIPMQNVSVNLQFLNSPQYSNNATVYTGRENAGPLDPVTGFYLTANLVFTTPITLSPGTYWISAWVVRPDALPVNAPGGQWFWYETNVGNVMAPLEFEYQNPDNGYGSGSGVQPGSNLTGTPADLAYEIDGIITPEPPTWCLLGLGGIGMLIAGRWKRINFPYTLQSCF